jgi:hypothetical protein
MTDDLLLKTLDGINASIEKVSDKVDALDNKMDERIERVTGAFHEHEVTTEGRLTKVEVKSGLIATLVSVFVAGVAAFIGWLK